MFHLFHLSRFKNGTKQDNTADWLSKNPGIKKAGSSPARFLEKLNYT